MMCFFMGNHKANKPENLFSLEVDNIRLQNLIDSGEASFATIREQTPDERELMRKLNKVK